MSSKAQEVSQEDDWTSPWSDDDLNDNVSKEINNSCTYSDDTNEDYDAGFEDSDDGSDDDDDYPDVEMKSGGISVSTKPFGGSHANKQVSSKDHFQPTDKAIGKYLNKINIDKYEAPLPSTAANLLSESNKKIEHERHRHKDKADRATVEQVMDPRTRMILFKLLSRGFISEISGCISTGKEANVYYGSTKTGQGRAIKVYKTSILVFKDRDKYVTGEFRFRHGYCRRNPRKMVRTWAEKEMRNLVRMHQAGIPCPEPMMLRSHVLVMDFIGKDGWPAPKLKDVTLPGSKARELYMQCIVMMRNIFQKAKLVHADLSEFNMLYHDGKCCVIDVSQSVEHDHPHALEFLRKDCSNINDFFKRKGVSTMTVRELFDFVTDPNITENNIDDYLERLMQKTAAYTEEERTEQEKIDEAVFKNAYIPRKLDDVIDFERDQRKVQQGDTSDLLYQTITGLKLDLSGPQQVPILLEDSEQGSEHILNNKSVGNATIDIESDKDQPESLELCNSDHLQQNLMYFRPRDESPNSKKDRKKAVKEEKREKRKEKMPKHIKKQKEKATRQGKRK